MARHKKHPPHEEHVDESWLVPYADLLTLLLALFIVLFASATPDEAKFQELMEKLYAVFHDLPEASGEVPDDWDPTNIIIPGVTDPNTTDPGATLPGEGEGGEGEGKGIGSLKAALDQYVSMNALENTVSVELVGENILLTLKNDMCFESGSKQVTVEMREKIEVIGLILKDNQDEEKPFEIIVAGHTDNVPMKTPGYSNWDLSVDRALECLRLLLRDNELDPSHFSVRGYGELQPVAPNDTSEGRRLNRRVEILISQPLEQSEE